MRPDPELRIALEGGIRIQHKQFLKGYPPQIRVYGSVPAYAELMIDGRPAEKAGDAFLATGFDSLGEHIVSCGTVSSTYVVVEPDDDWESWPAYTFSLPVQGGFVDSASICGALVGEAGAPVLLVPTSTPVLLGSQPGEIYAAPVRQDLRMPVCQAFPSFTPVWAVPREPLRADKAAVRVLLLQEHAPAAKNDRKRRVRPDSAVIKWYTAILDCCRKGLSIEPADHKAQKLWMAYRALARCLWRASR